MLGFDAATTAYLVAGVALALVSVFAVIVFVLELRRAGGAPWSEYYNDRVVWPYRRRSRAASVKVTTPASPREGSRSRAA